LINAEEVEKILVDCLYKPEELLDDKVPVNAVIVEGIMSKFAFNPEQLEKYKNRIIELLSELPVQFRQDSGGGWSFLNACNTKDGKQWTGLHLRMEQLFMLGMAIGKAKFLMPREMWKMFPGSMPYIVIKIR